MVFTTKVYVDDVDEEFEWTDEEEVEREIDLSSDDEELGDESNDLVRARLLPKKQGVEHDGVAFQRAKPMDEAHFDDIVDPDVKAIVEMTNKREKEMFTGKGKEFIYPTEWKDTEDCCGVCRLKVHQVMDGLIMRTLAMILVVIDVTVVIYQVVEEANTACKIISLLIVTYFLVDLILRVFAWGKTFFKDWMEVFDGLVILITFSVTVVIEVMYFTMNTEIKYASLVVVLRLVRFVLYIRIFYYTWQSIYTALRYKAIRSKKIYEEDGYKLDLTYITPNVIAMSFPSSGSREIRSFPPTKVDMELAIRNPREEVARFFNEKYPDGHYKIYNLCKERGYDTTIFNDQVARFKIVDHNVPTMRELLDFCRDVDEYMKGDQSNVIAVHCKGGKGRTGCCIASWLLYSGQFKTAKAALDFFGGRRMDVAKGVKFQGVETPSQKRWVYYLETVMKKMRGQLPPPKEVLVKSLEIKGLDASVYSDLKMEVVIDDVVKHKIVIVSKGEKNPKRVFMKFKDQIQVAGDVKFRFKSKALGRDYDNCAFFFWLHTSFIQRNKFEAGRDELGNANKPKHYDKYTEQFNVKLVFAPVKRGRTTGDDTVIEIGR